MNKRTLGINATNSAAISDDGKVFVWGFKRFGLIPDDGKGSKTTYQSTPQELKLNFGEHAVADGNDDLGSIQSSDVIDSDEEEDLSEYSATSIL